MSSYKCDCCKEQAHYHLRELTEYKDSFVCKGCLVLWIFKFIDFLAEDQPKVVKEMQEVFDRLDASNIPKALLGGLFRAVTEKVTHEGDNPPHEPSE
jgi:hypothetical protein